MGEREDRTVGDFVGRNVVGARVLGGGLGASVSKMGRPDNDVGEGVFTIGAGVVVIPVMGAEVSEMGAGVGTLSDGTDSGALVGVPPSDPDEIGCGVVNPNGGRVNIDSLVGSDSDATGAGLAVSEETVSFGVGRGEVTAPVVAEGASVGTGFKA